jgi:tRNA(fMet)-specific endonuclease VapC
VTSQYLLDTNVVSEPLKPRPNARVMARLKQSSATSALPSVVWHELMYGLERLPLSRRRRYVERYLREVVEPSFEILAYDKAAGRWHAHERARLEILGRPASFIDGQIAAIAAVRGLVLITRNTRHFESFDGIIVENWFT